METEIDLTTVEAVVYALPEIVRGINATRNDLSPGLRMPQLRALLRVARDEGLTMGDLARQLGVDPSTLARWERGNRSPKGEFVSALKAIIS